MRRRSRIAWLAFALALSACSSGREPTDATPTASTAPAPVPAPAGLVGELRLERPGLAWSDARAAVGGPLAVLPRSHGGLWASLLGLPIGLASELDESRPIVAVLRAGPLAALDWAAALPLRESRRFLLRVRTEASDRFVVDPPSLEGLTPVRRTTKGAARGRLPDVALAVMDDQLLLGSSPTSVAALGPYLARTSARRTEDSLFAANGFAKQVGVPAVGGPADGARLALIADGKSLADLVEPLLARVVDELGATGLGGLASVVEPAELRQWTHEVLSSAGTVGARAELLRDALAIHARVRFTREMPAQSRSVGGVDLGRLLRAPSDSVFVVGWAEPARRRLEAAEQTTKELLDWLGTATADVEPRARRALRAVAAGRGDWTAAGLRCTGVGLTAFATGPAADEKELRRGLREVTDLRQHPSVAKRLESAGLKASSRRMRVPHWPQDLLGIRLRSRAPQAGPAPAHAVVPPAPPAPTSAPAAVVVERLDPIELLTTVGAGEFVAAAGVESADTIRLLLQPGEGHTIGTVVHPGGPVGDPARAVWATVSLDPIGLARCARGQVAGDWARRVVASIGFAEDPSVGWIELEVGAALLAALGTEGSAGSR